MAIFDQYANSGMERLCVTIPYKHNYIKNGKQNCMKK